MESRAGVAFVDIEGDFSKLTADVKTALKDTAKRFNTLPDVTADGDFSRATSAAQQAVGRIDSAIGSIPDVQVDGDFSGVQSAGDRALGGIDAEIGSIPDVQVDGDFSGAENASTSAVDGIKDKLGSLSGFAKGAGAGAGTAGALALGVAFTSALSLEASRDKLAAQLGLTGKEAKIAGDIAGNLWAGAYGESIEQVDQAVADVYRNIGEMGRKETERATRDSLNLVQTFGTDAGEVSRTVGALIKNGMAKNTREAFDLITVGFQQGADKGGEFLDTLNEYAQPVKDLGLNARDFTSILVRGLENGVYSVDKIGDALKEFQIRVIDGSDTTKAAFEGIGLNADEMAKKFGEGGKSARDAMSETLQALRGVDDAVAQDAAGVGLFGAMWEDVGAKAVLGMDPAIDSLGKVDGAANKLDKTIGDNLMTRFEAFKRQALQAVATFILDTVIPAVSNLSSTFSDMKRIAESAFGFFQPTLSQLKPLFEDVFGGIMGIVRTFKGVLTGDFGEMWSGIKDVFRNGKDFVLDMLNAMIAPVKAVAGRIGDGIVGPFNIVKEIPGKIGDALGNGVDRLASFVDRFVDRGVKLGKSVVSGVGSGLDDFVSRIGDVVGRGADRIIGFADSFLGKATSLGKNAVRGIAEGLGDFAGKIGEAIASGADKLVGAVESFIDKAAKLGKGVVAGLAAGLSQIGTTIAGAISSAVRGIGDVAKSVLNFIIGALNTAIPNSIAIPRGPDIPLPDNPIRYLAKGAVNFPGGLAIVGEQGRELVQLPRGANVLPNRKTERVLSPRSNFSGTAEATGAVFGDLYAEIQIGGEKIDERVQVQIRERDHANGQLYRAGALG